jgi:hypothetical protein
MSSDSTLDAIGPREDTAVGTGPILEGKGDTVWTLLNVCETLAELDAIFRDKACHDFEQFFAVSLAWWSNVLIFFICQVDELTDLRI